jgi:hypothetical protein
MPNVGSRLSWFSTRDGGVGIDETEGIYDDFAFDGLDRVNYNSYRSGV